MTPIKIIWFLFFSLSLGLAQPDSTKPLNSVLEAQKNSKFIRLLVFDVPGNRYVGYAVSVDNCPSLKVSLNEFLSKCKLSKIESPEQALINGISSNSLFYLQFVTAAGHKSKLTYIGGYSVWTESKDWLLLTHKHETGIQEAITKMFRTLPPDCCSTTFFEEMNATKMDDFFK